VRPHGTLIGEEGVLLIGLIARLVVHVLAASGAQNRQGGQAQAKERAA
jgi:hypothetical protein